MEIKQSNFELLCSLGLFKGTSTDWETLDKKLDKLTEYSKDCGILQEDWVNYFGKMHSSACVSYPTQLVKELFNTLLSIMESRLHRAILGNSSHSIDTILSHLKQLSLLKPKIYTGE